MGRKKVKQFSASGSETSSIPSKNTDRVRGRKGGRRRRKTARSKGRWKRGRGRRYRTGRWGIRSLETRVGRESSVSKGGAGLYSGGIHVGAVGRGSHSVTAGGTAPRVRAAKGSELGEEKL